jgi:hypothetical protein
MMWVLILLAMSGRTATPAADNFGQPFPAFVPADIRLFVIDAQACTHFRGEPYDDQHKDRKAFLDKMVAKTCPSLDRRKAGLERRYRRSARIERVISEAWEE